MGYRSNIGFALDKGLYLKYEMLTNGLPKILKEGKRLEANDAFYWFFDDWKWYPSYPDIGQMETFMTRLDDDTEMNSEIILNKESNCGYAFIRLGEETEDIEHRGDTYDYELYVQRDIDTPFGYLCGIEESN